jgi:hypothetical protein
MPWRARCGQRSRATKRGPTYLGYALIQRDWLREYGFVLVVMGPTVRETRPLGGDRASSSGSVRSRSSNSSTRRLFTISYPPTHRLIFQQVAEELGEAIAFASAEAGVEAAWAAEWCRCQAWIVVWGSVGHGRVPSSFGRRIRW